MLPQFISLFLFGLAIGSFLNVFIDRNITKESFILGKSHCDKCKKNLAWYDLFPLLSFALLKGSCRYCHSKLSAYYPLTELSTGVLFIATYIFVNNSFGQQPLILLYYLFLMCSLIAIFFSDIKYGIIPDRITYPAIIVAIFYLITYSPNAIVSNFLSAFFAFLFFLILILITKGRGMGIGDLKLVVLIGLFLGFPSTIMALYLAFLTGAVVGIILILCRIKKLRGSTIPFGPFLVFGTIASLFFMNLLGKIFFPGLF